MVVFIHQRYWYDGLNKGQRNKILKNEAIKALFESGFHPLCDLKRTKPGETPAGSLCGGNMGKRNELSALTRRECEFLVRECNFTRDERDVFNLRIQDWSVVHISIELCMSESKVKRKLFDIKQKIEKVRSE